MVKLIDDYKTEAIKFNKAGIKVPEFDQVSTTQNGITNPVWIHFGGGNLFRSYHSLIAQDLLNKGELEGGIIVAGTYDEEIMSKAYYPYDNRFLSVVMNNDGTLSKQLIASVAQSIYYNITNKNGWNELTEAFKKPSLQMVTFSITEKGYSLHDINGNLTKAAEEDIKNGPDKPITTMGAVAHLLYARYQNGELPIAMVSTDNFSQNGKTLEDRIMTIANGWKENGLVDSGFIKYLQNRKKVTFPWTMIDRITPNPSEVVANELQKQGFEDTNIIHTSMNTNIAPFANTEQVHYLVIEDDFPNGRPALEKAGVMMVSRNTVNDADQMKVTACLNPLHTALAVFGCILDYHSIYEEVQNKDILNLIKNLGYGEDLPVVKDPKVIDPHHFLYEFINERLMNKNIPDTPQRIATDTSQKIPVRYGVTIQHYINDPQKNPKTLEFIPLVIAGWCRYLLGVTDQGKKFTPSRDPLLNQLQAFLSSITIGDQDNDVHSALKPILTNKEIFGCDMYEIGLGQKVEDYFASMITGNNAVIKTIKATLKNKSYKFNERK